MKAYKGFDKDLKCRGYQYELGKEYETAEKPVKCTENGFHACEYPLDVFSYYSPADSRFCEVDQSGEIDKGDDDTKVASSKIKIGAEIGIPALVKASVEYIKERIVKTAEKNKSQSAATNTGDRSAATNTGNWSAATNTGNWSAATNTGNRSAATNTGDWSAATNTGDRSAAIVDKPSSIAVSWGVEGKAKGVKGSHIVCAEWEYKGSEYILKAAKMVEVDGVNIKENTYYRLKDGEFTEVEND